MGQVYYYEKRFPGGHCINIEIPAGTAIELYEDAYNQIVSREDLNGNKIFNFEILADDAPVDISIPQEIEKIMNEMNSEGYAVSAQISAPVKPSVRSSIRKAKGGSSLTESMSES